MLLICSVPVRIPLLRKLELGPVLLRVNLSPNPPSPPSDESLARNNKSIYWEYITSGLEIEWICCTLGH